ncbi:MAG: hypothetical protein HY401_05110 [Elusimicrobia bacterium]|nr:hypothetical protein [Elusimicrobiota bacterium]
MKRTMLSIAVSVAVLSIGLPYELAAAKTQLRATSKRNARLLAASETPTIETGPLTNEEVTELFDRVNKQGKTSKGYRVITVNDVNTGRWENLPPLNITLKYRIPKPNEARLSALKVSYRGEAPVEQVFGGYSRGTLLENSSFGLKGTLNLSRQGVLTRPTIGATLGKALIDVRLALGLTQAGEQANVANPRFQKDLAEYAGTFLRATLIRLRGATIAAARLASKV